jgi:hypothetical protein
LGLQPKSNDTSGFLITPTGFESARAWSSVVANGQKTRKIRASSAAGQSPSRWLHDKSADLRASRAAKYQRMPSPHPVGPQEAQKPGTAIAHVLPKKIFKNFAPPAHENDCPPTTARWRSRGPS